MPSKIYRICNRYESGFGHGLKNDGFDLSKTPHSDPDEGEAYQIGYEAGSSRGSINPANDKLNKISSIINAASVMYDKKLNLGPVVTINGEYYIPEKGAYDTLQYIAKILEEK